MFWINFLHLYQPSNADGHIIQEATDKSYWRIVRGLEEHPRIKFTLNISGCLILRWEEFKYFDLIKRLKKLLEKGQIELVGSAAYHPILPLIPKEEAIKQIKENETILNKYFGVKKPTGFFLPEMAYSAGAAKIIKNLGYEWLILDEIAYNGRLGEIDCNKLYQDKNSGLKIIFRDRKISKSYVPETILKILKSKTGRDKAIITATDGELYGLRHNDPTAEFEKLLDAKDIKTLTVSEFIKSSQKTAKEIKPTDCSWESTEKELKNGMPYCLWFNKKNKIQQKLWQLANMAYEIIENYRQDENYYWARWHLVRGLASCTFWWASAQDFHLFGLISWNPDEVERGANELIRSIRALGDVATRNNKIKAEKLYIKIKQLVWKKHWKYYWKK